MEASGSDEGKREKEKEREFAKKGESRLKVDKEQ